VSDAVSVLADERELPGEAPETYEDLVRLYPPRKIHDQIELENATEVADRVAIRAQNDAQLDYLELLGDLLNEYENRSTKPYKASPPLEILNYLILENDISTRKLGKTLGVDHSVTARMLKGERAITVEHAKSFGARFKVDPKVFLEL
jgi:HTH-type transcriptional regulator / antitoxin HigA